MPVGGWIVGGATGVGDAGAAVRIVGVGLALGADAAGAHAVAAATTRMRRLASRSNP